MYFNPHEREARDLCAVSDSMKSKYFNPHEREARDLRGFFCIAVILILIHTSVKLVTDVPERINTQLDILIHTSVKLVTPNR